MRLIVLSPLLLLAGCGFPAASVELAAAQPVFVPTTFFAGDTEGHARLTVLFHGSRPVHVIGHGRVDPDGTLVLDQLVTGAGKHPEQREWRIHETKPGHYAGTLSDAKGPIAGDVHGNCLHLRFEMKDGMAAQQWIYLQPGGQTALNRMTISKWGIQVAQLDETIDRAR